MNGVSINTVTKVLIAIRDAEYVQATITDLTSRLANWVQLTGDGYKACTRAVEKSFGSEIDFSLLVNLYGAPDGNMQECRYSTRKCCGTGVRLAFSKARERVAFAV